MATPTSYTYYISSDFPNGIVATDRLQHDIRNSVISTALDRIDTLGNNCEVWFKDALNDDDRNALNFIVSVHTGQPLDGLAVTGSLTEEGSVVGLTPENYANVGVQIAGEWSGTIAVEATIDGSAWYPMQLFSSSGGMAISEIYSNGQFTMAVSGVRQIRLRMKQYASGSASVSMVASSRASVVRILQPSNEDRVPLASMEPRTGTELIACTHNFCDPTTWFATSVRVEDEALTDSGDGVVWNGTHPNWIDLIHGKMYDEDSTASSVEHGYQVVISVDGVAMTARAPFAMTGGDYEVDYHTGAVTFAESQAGKTVTASYSYSTDSTWILAPYPGYRIDIETVEAQFSADTILRDTIQFNIWGYNPEDLPNKMLYVQSAYKTMKNFVDEAQGSYPVVPPIGGNEGRGTLAAIYGFPFRYGTIRKVQSSLGLELRVRLANDTPFGGEHATATFYCTIREDV